VIFRKNFGFLMVLWLFAR